LRDPASARKPWPRTQFERRWIASILDADDKPRMIVLAHSMYRLILKSFFPIP